MSSNGDSSTFDVLVAETELVNTTAGKISTIQLDRVVDSRYFNLVWTTNQGGSTTGVTQIAEIGIEIGVIPEPATLGLLTGGLALLAIRRRRY